MVKVRGTLGTLEVCPTVLMEYEFMSVYLSVLSTQILVCRLSAFLACLQSNLTASFQSGRLGNQSEVFMITTADGHLHKDPSQILKCGPDSKVKTYPRSKKQALGSRARMWTRARHTSKLPRDAEPGKLRYLWDSSQMRTRLLSLLPQITSLCSICLLESRGDAEQPPSIAGLS